MKKWSIQQQQYYTHNGDVLYKNNRECKKFDPMKMYAKREPYLRFVGSIILLRTREAPSSYSAIVWGVGKSSLMAMAIAYTTTKTKTKYSRVFDSRERN